LILNDLSPNQVHQLDNAVTRPREIHPCDGHFYHSIEIGIRKHDERIFTAELQGYTFNAALGCGALNGKARLHRPCKANASDQSMTNKRITRWGTVSMNYIDETRRQIC